MRPQNGLSRLQLCIRAFQRAEQGCRYQPGLQSAGQTSLNNTIRHLAESMPPIRCPAAFRGAARRGRKKSSLPSFLSVGARFALINDFSPDWSSSTIRGTVLPHPDKRYSRGSACRHRRVYTIPPPSSRRSVDRLPHRLIRQQHHRRCRSSVEASRASVSCRRRVCPPCGRWKQVRSVKVSRR